MPHDTVEPVVTGGRMERTEREPVTVHKGFVPLVIGDDVRVRQSGAVIIGARRDMRLSQGGGQWLVALRDQTIRYGGGALLVSRQAQVTNGFVGVVVGETVTLGGRARALVSVPPRVAAAAAVAFAIGLTIGRWRRDRTASQGPPRAL
jgi:hypothetical protein